MLTFVAPPPASSLSGGNLYNHNLLSALQPLCPVRLIDLADWRADDLDDDLANTLNSRPLASAEPAPRWYVVDSLYLDAIPEYLARRSPDSRVRVLLLAHLLPSDDPDAASRQELELERLVLSIVDGACATSTSVGASLGERGVPVERIVTVPPAAEFPVSEAPRRSAPDRASTDDTRVLLVGNVIPRKGFLELLQALDERIAPDDPLSMDIVGHLDMDPQYARLCTQFALSSAAMSGRVRFRGPVPHAEMARWYDRAALFVSSARAETFGMALQEARQMGLPLLVMRGGHSEVHVPGPEVGFTYSDIGELADGLLDLIRTPTRLAELGASAWHARLAADYTWTQAAQSLLDQLRAAPAVPRAPSMSRPQAEGPKQ